VLEAVEYTAGIDKFGLGADTRGIYKYLKTKWPTVRWDNNELRARAGAVKDALAAGLLVPSVGGYMKIGKPWDGNQIWCSLDSAVANHNAGRAAKGRDPLSRKRAMNHISDERVFGASVANNTMPAPLRQKVDTGEMLPGTALKHVYAERAFGASVADNMMPAPLRQRVYTGEILPGTALKTFRGDVKFDRALREMRPAIEAALSRADKAISEGGGGAATTKPKRKWAFNARFAHLAVGMKLFGF
jgi:hypothetical protein